MRTLKTMRPGNKGTKELVARYGTSLLCVRYRFDDLTRERVKTVELIVQRRSAEAGSERAVPKVTPGGAAGSRAPVALARSATRQLALSRRRSPGRKVALRIHWGETQVRHQIKSAGGWWDPNRRLWLLRRDQAERLGLLHRVAGGAGG